MERIYIRLEKNQKNQLSKLSAKYGLSITDYVKYKIFDQNSDFANNEYIFQCPSGERYNYSIAGLSMLNHLVLKALTEKLYGEQSIAVISDSIKETRSKLEELYNYKKIKVEADE